MPAVSAAYAIEHPFVEPCGERRRRSTPSRVTGRTSLDDARRHQPIQLELFPGMRDYYAASDAHLAAANAATRGGFAAAPYPPHSRSGSSCRRTARAAARRRLGDDAAIALMPARLGRPRAVPVDALVAADPRRAARGRGSCSSASCAPTGAERPRSAATSSAALRAHPSTPLDAFDLPLAEQLALVEACDVFLAPHTGFGMAALAVGTPWLALSGGRWFEYFFNHVPFRSILPDPERYGGFTQFAEPPRVDDDGPRIAGMTEARVREDLERIVAAAQRADRRPR